MVEKDSGKMYMSVCKLTDCKVVDVTIDMDDDTSMPISIKIRRDKDATSDLYLALSLDLANQLQAKLASALQDIQMAQEDIIKGAKKESHDDMDALDRSNEID